MKADLKPGISSTRKFTIDKPRTIDFLGENLRVYATPELVRDMEITCRELLRAYCEPGEDSVGTGIDIAHSGATLLGANVEVTATVQAVDGRKVTFEVVARDHAEEIGRAEHGRFVVDIEKLRSRVAAKAQKSS
jgi:fluoroacetyl-CoA thioesterase